MKPLFLLLFALVVFLTLPSHSVIAKSAGLGIYATVNQVTFEPNDSSPNEIRISGVFVVPVPMSSGDYRAPEKGCLYLRITPGTEELARRDWKQLKSVAGSDQVVAFGQYWVPSPTTDGNPHHSLNVRVNGTCDSASPDFYPIPLSGGVLKTTEIKSSPERDPELPRITKQLQEYSHH